MQQLDQRVSVTQIMRSGHQKQRLDSFGFSADCQQYARNKYFSCFTTATIVLLRTDFKSNLSLYSLYYVEA